MLEQFKTMTCLRSRFMSVVSFSLLILFTLKHKGDVTRDDSQGRFFQNTALQCWNNVVTNLKPRRNNVATLCCA